MEHETSPAGCMRSWQADAVLDYGGGEVGELVEEEDERLRRAFAEMARGSGDGDRGAAAAETVTVVAAQEREIGRRCGCQNGGGSSC
eukprot:3092926-Prorocentrum_lima.AAC.1